MIYIDDYSSKAITNSPPKKEDRIELAKAKTEMNGKQLAAFWYIAGVTIASNYKDVKELLSKYGYDVSNEHDAASAIANIYGTPKWIKFIAEFGDIIEASVDENLIIDSIGGEESSWVQALIAAVGAVASSSLTLAKSSKDKKAAESNAKSAMFVGITNVLAEKEKVKAEKEKTMRESKSGIIWIVIAVLVVIGLIIGFVIYKKNKAKNAAAA